MTSDHKEIPKSQNQKSQNVRNTVLVLSDRAFIYPEWTLNQLSLFVNTAVLLNFTRYMGMSQKIMPYTRTAIGINTGQAKYLNADGTKATEDDGSTSLAYQVGLGCQFNVTKHGGFFVEAGYGKYIVSGGLKMSF